MGAASLIGPFLALLKLLFAEADRQRERAVREGFMDMGRTAALKGVLDGTVKFIAEAQAARTDFRDDLRAHPERLSDDDGFKRPLAAGKIKPGG